MKIFFSACPAASHAPNLVVPIYEDSGIGMLNVDTNRLNPQERKILETLRTYSRDHDAPTITEAAEICGCSVSQVSKAIKKAGFKGYKRYMGYLYYGELPRENTPAELDRLCRVIDEFDTSLVDQFVELIDTHEKIILFGYGPSHIAAQYFEYKLQFCTETFITTPRDEQSVRGVLDEGSLLAIFTTTGQYRSFADISSFARSRGADVLVVSEEYNPILMENCDRYFVLSRHPQSKSLQPYEKTRTVFFIFFELVIEKILARRAAAEHPH